MIAKDVKIGYFNWTNYAPDITMLDTAKGTYSIFIPESNKTSAQIDGHWTSLPYSTDWFQSGNVPTSDLITLLNLLQYNEFYWPYPGEYTNYDSSINVTNANQAFGTINALNFGCVQGNFDYTYSDSVGTQRAIGLYDDNGNVWAGYGYGLTGYNIGGNTKYGQDWYQPIFMYSTGSASGNFSFGGLIKCSDDILIHYVLRINKNNSSWHVLSATDSARILAFINGLPKSSTDPYSKGGNSGRGGGGGTYSFPSDTVDFPGLPTLSAADAGFCTLYNPTKAQLQSLANYFWNTLDLSTLKVLFASPIDAVLGLCIVPVSPTTGSSQVIKIGNVSSTVSANIITNQYKEVDCGSVTVSEHWGSYLDYDAFTHCDIYLPYIGVRTLNMSEIMGKTVAVKYHVDVLSGSCVAYIKCGDNVLYSYSGSCGVQVPVTASTFSASIGSALSMAATGLEKIANAVSGITESAKSVATSVFNAGRNQVQRSGSIGGSAGIMSIQYPYLIFTFPNQSVPDDQNTFTGYPSNITAKLENLFGYTEIDYIHLTGIPATSAELEEISQLLDEGVIL